MLICVKYKFLIKILTFSISISISQVQSHSLKRSQVPENSFISSMPIVDGFYRIVGPNGGELFPGVPCVDIAQDDLFRSVLNSLILKIY